MEIKGQIQDKLEYLKNEYNLKLYNEKDIQKEITDYITVYKDFTKGWEETKEEITRTETYRERIPIPENIERHKKAKTELEKLYKTTQDKDVRKQIASILQINDITYQLDEITIWKEKTTNKKLKQMYLNTKHDCQSKRRIAKIINNPAIILWLNLIPIFQSILNLFASCYIIGKYFITKTVFIPSLIIGTTLTLLLILPEYYYNETSYTFDISILLPIILLSLIIGAPTALVFKTFIIDQK